MRRTAVLFVALALAASVGHASARQLTQDTTTTSPAAVAVGPASSISSTPQTLGNDTIAGVLSTRPELSTFLELIDGSNLKNITIDPSTNITLFAPTNTAFENSLNSLNLTATQFSNSSAYQSFILAIHFVPEARPASTLSDGVVLHTLLDTTLTISNIAGKVRVIAPSDNATVVTPDIMAGGSVIHVIDNVLL